MFFLGPSGLVGGWELGAMNTCPCLRSCPPQCSVTCGAGVQHRLVECTHSPDCDEAQRPASEGPCSRPPCEGPDSSGSGSSSHEDFNEVDVVPGGRVPRPPTPMPAIVSNAIEDPIERLEPVIVDDFYYDYNFINFHENLDSWPLAEQGSDQGDLWGWTSPIETPTPAAESLPDWTPPPTPGQAGHIPSLPSEQTLEDPWDRISTEAPDLRLPHWVWPLPPGDSVESPPAPGSEEGSHWWSPPGWERNEEFAGHSESPLLPSASTQRLWTDSPVGHELWPAPTDTPRETWDREGPGDLELPTLSPAGPTLVGVRSFLLTAPSPHPPPRAPQHRPANSSGTPEAHPDASLDQEGLPSLVPPDRNASWEVGDWSEASMGRGTAGGTLEAYLTCRAWAGQGSPPLWASVAPDLAGWCCSFPSPGGKVLVGVGPCRRCETHWLAMVWVFAWPSHPCPLSAPPPVAWALCGGPCSAALAGMRTVPLLPDPSLPATATCGPALCGMPATGAKCVRNPR